MFKHERIRPVLAQQLRASPGPKYIPGIYHQAKLISECEKQLAFPKIFNINLNVRANTIKHVCVKMLRKSVETRDWLNTIEPRTVRAVMKRVVEDVAAVEGQVGVLYEEGVKSERSSDSSRKTQGYRLVM